jgi:C-terminal processing protease CtpA/Prc
MKKTWPIRSRLKDGRVFIASVQEQYATQIKPGDEIVQINGNPLDVILRDMNLLLGVSVNHQGRLSLQLKEESGRLKDVEIREQKLPLPDR